MVKYISVFLNQGGIPLIRVQHFTLQSTCIHASFIICDVVNRNGKITWFIKNLIFKLVGVHTWQKHLPAIFWLVMNKPVWT